MKTIKFLFVLIAFTSLWMSCNKTDDDVLEVDEYLIFGHFYGFCQGETCIEIYKLENGKLYEDSNDDYPGSTDYYNANFTELSNNIFEEVDGLQDVFPSGLLNETEVVLGSPDAGDWGGLYIEYNKDGLKDFWLLDQMKSNVSEEYHDFIDAVNAKIDLINQ